MDHTSEHESPCPALEAVQAEVIALPAKLKRDIISQRALALALVVCVAILLGLAIYLKAVSSDVVSAIIGTLAGRLTSNIGSDNAQTQGKT